MNYPNSFYVDDAAFLIKQSASGSADNLAKKFDVIVVGGGYAGLYCALELARSGKSVALFESKKIGWGASGRNGGFVSAGFSQDLSSLTKKLGRDHAEALFSLSRQGLEIVRREAEAIDPAVIEGHGSLSALRYPDPDGIARSMQEYAALGLTVRHVLKRELRELLKTECYFEAIENQDSFHIQPLKYALGLAQKARIAGACIVEECAVTDLENTKGGWSVKAAGTWFGAEHVVLAGSAHMSGLYPPLSAAILPVATYVITSEPMPDVLDQAIGYLGCISDTRRAGDYYRRLPDGRLLWGGRMTTRRSEPKALGVMLQRDILKIYPQLGPFKISHAWSGLMGYAVHKMPIIGELTPGLWAATGFGGHGLNTTAMSGQLIASAIVEKDDRWRQFSAFGAVWAGGLFGRAATQSVYWYMQGRDWCDEVRNRQGKRVS